MDNRFNGVASFGDLREVTEAGKLINFTNVNSVHIHIHSDGKRNASANGVHSVRCTAKSVQNSKKNRVARTGG